MSNLTKYQAAEKRLAELLGLTWIDDPAFPELQFCRKWEACGPLMVEYGCYPKESDNIDIVDRYVPVIVVGDLRIEVADHPNKGTAVMFAIVMAVIAKLEAKAI